MTALALAFTAGLLATVNPCGFAMLPAFLSFYLGATEPDQQRQDLSGVRGGRLGHGLAVGLAVSAGFAGVFVAAALLAAAGLSVLVRLVPWAALGIGVVLVGLGGWLLAGRHLGLTVPSRLRPEAGRSYRRVVAFGAAYALASLSCTLAVLLALTGQALATASPLRLVAVLAGYAVGAASVLVALSVSVAMAKDALLQRVRRLLPLAGRLAGGLLVVSGLYLVAYWAPTLTHPSTPTVPALAGVGAALSARLTGLLLAGRGLFAALAAAIAVGAAGLAIWRWTRTPTRAHRRARLPFGAGRADAAPVRRGKEPP
jgi:cytochrome c-type biogenesis protein